MTRSRFDEAVKALASGTSRRQVVKTLVGGTGVAAIAAVGLRQEASAALGPKGAQCGNGNQCKSGLLHRPCVQAASALQLGLQ